MVWISQETQWSTFFQKCFSQSLFDGGDKRDRTADLLNAIQALSQLSYTPIFERWSLSLRRFQVRVYNQWTRFSAEKPRRLKQSPGLFLRAGFRVHFGFLELLFPTIETFRRISNVFYHWWAKMDSNHRPHDYQSCALASWAIGPFCLCFSKVQFLLHPLNWIT